MAQLKPSLLRHLQRRVRAVRRDLRHAWPCPPHMQLRVLRRGRRARRRERAQGRLRLEGPAEPGARAIAGRAGPAGHPLPRGLPRPQRLHALAHQHRPASRPTTSRSSPGRASTTPSCASPSRPRSSATWPPPRSARSTQIERAFADNPDDIAAILIEPIQAEGGDNHFRPEFLQRAASDWRDEHEVLLHLRRGADGRRPHRAACGPTSTSGSRPTPSPSARRRRSCGCLVGPARRRGAGERLQGAPRASTRPGAAASPTWCASARYLEIIHEERLVENARVVGEHLLAGLQRARRRAGRHCMTQRARARPDDRLRPAHAGAARQALERRRSRTACCCCPAARARSASVRRST